MKEPEGFRKPIKTGTTKEVGLAVVTMGQAAGMEFGQCSCGWAGYHKRLKVLDDRIDKHFERKHKGKGIRL